MILKGLSTRLFSLVIANMGFRQKQLSWIRFSISVARFSMLVIEPRYLLFTDDASVIC